IHTVPPKHMWKDNGMLYTKVNVKQHSVGDTSLLNVVDEGESEIIYWMYIYTLMFIIIDSMYCYNYVLLLLLLILFKLCTSNFNFKYIINDHNNNNNNNNYCHYIIS